MAANIYAYSIILNHWVDGSGYSCSEDFDAGKADHIMAADEWLRACADNGNDLRDLLRSDDVNVRCIIYDEDGDIVSNTAAWLSDYLD